MKRALILASAVAVVVIVGAVTIRSCARSPDTSNLVTSSDAADPGDGGGTTAGPGGGSGPNGSDKGDPLDPTSSETTSTSASSTTSTTRRPTAPTTPTAPSTPVVPPGGPPPAPRDTTPPVVTNLVRSVGDISADLGECQYPTTTVLSATITDDSGVAGATITWSTKGHSGTLTLAPDQGSTWSATLGPIFDQTLTTSDSAPVDWSVEAVDTAGNRAGGTAGGRGAVTFHGCVFDPHGGIG